MTLEPGDLILVKSEGRFFAFGRRVAKNPYDHVAVVASDGCTINIDKPRTRLLPQERLLRPSLEPLVLRPAFAAPTERAAFVTELERLVRAPYDVRRTLQLLGRLLLRRVGISVPLRKLDWDRERWICTDAVLLSLERHVRAFAHLRELPLDWCALQSGTTNDLLEIHRLRPDLLQRVAV